MERLIEVIKKAGEIVKEGFNKTKEIKFKGEIDLVTEYDVRVEEYLKKELSLLMPEYKIIAEETNNLEDKNHPNKIIIDPIDGTTNFVHQIPYVAISVGVITDNKLDFGVVYNPICDELYSAKVGKGAYLNGEKISVSTKTDLKKSLLATGFPYSITTNNSDYDFTMKFIAKALKNVVGVRRMGAAALDLCYLARGSVDVYYEMNLKPWDVCAGIIIVQEAGGEVTNLDSKEFSLFEDKYIVATNKNLHNDFVNIING
jgi:myo-inositol-1(or 4)-monophosphatase